MKHDCRRCARLGVRQPADRMKFGEPLCVECIDDVESQEGF